MGRPTGAYGHKRKGRLSLAERTQLQAAATSDLPVEKIAAHLAPVMGRSEEALKAGIIKARQELQAQASDYVALLRRGAEKAATKGNVNGLLNVLERIEAGGERVVKPLQTEQASSGIKIILANVRMGGTREKETDIEVIDAEG